MSNGIEAYQVSYHVQSLRAGRWSDTVERKVDSSNVPTFAWPCRHGAPLPDLIVFKYGGSHIRQWMGEAHEGDRTQESELEGGE